MARAKVGHVIKILILSLIAIIYMIPVWLMLVGSFKSRGEAMKFELSLPKTWDFSNYAYVFQEGNILRGYWNSLVITVGVVVLTLLFGSLAGIYVGRNKSKGAGAIYNYFIMGISLTFQTATIFALLKAIGLYSTQTGVILVLAATQLPFTVMTFSSFIHGVPRDIDEAGIIDGCGPLRLIFKILIPIMKPIFITNLIVVAIGAWNNFMVPLFYLGSSTKWPLTLSIYGFFGMYQRNWNYVFAILIIIIAPVIILYLCLQKYIVEGMTSGAVKG